MSVYDVSMPLKTGMAVWPGDERFSYHKTVSKEESGVANVGQVSMSTHTGTHVDAPYHFDEAGRKVSELDVSLYIGDAQVLDVTGSDDTITVSHLIEAGVTEGRRLLLKTNAWMNRESFPERFPVLATDVPAFLKNKGIQLLGFDVPSVDPLESEDLPIHHGLDECGIAILESLVLTDVPSGQYELIALPLSFVEADGSPVRAILRTL